MVQKCLPQNYIYSYQTNIIHKKDIGKWIYVRTFMLRTASPSVSIWLVCHLISGTSIQFRFPYLTGFIISIFPYIHRINPYLPDLTGFQHKKIFRKFSTKWLFHLIFFSLKNFSTIFFSSFLLPKMKFHSFTSWKQILDYSIIIIYTYTLVCYYCRNRFHWKQNNREFRVLVLSLRQIVNKYWPVRNMYIIIFCEKAENQVCNGVASDRS